MSQFHLKMHLDRSTGQIAQVMIDVPEADLGITARDFAERYFVPAAHALWNKINQVPLARYKCHKEVSASRIVNVSDVLITVKSDDGQCANIFVGHSWIEKHKPVVGGYFVRYDDGYESFSPAQAFESGYTRSGYTRI